MGAEGGCTPPFIPAAERRSGRIPALPYPPLRCAQYKANGAKIEDVTRPRNLLIVSALASVLLMFGWLAYREFRLRYAQWKYSRALIPGTRKQDIENRFLSTGIRFFRESPNVDFVSVGYEVRYSLACAPREVGLLLEFRARDGASSEAEILQGIKPVRRERGCM